MEHVTYLSRQRAGEGTIKDDMRPDIRISVLHEAPPVPWPPTTALLCPPSCLANRVSQLNQQNNFLLDKTRNVSIAEWDDPAEQEC